jgi:Protein of unknown function (DUF429)
VNLGGRTHKLVPVRAIGIHLLQSVDLIDTPRRSVVVEMTPDGAVSDIHMVGSLDEIVATLGTEPALVVVDAPIVVPNQTGQRDVERILAWCDVPAFPISRARLASVFGGARGSELASRMPPETVLHETHLDLALRLAMWEQATGDAHLDLADYRAQWLGLRAPRYRPKGAGRARPEGIIAAAGVLAHVVDLGGWTPDLAGDDWTLINDAAILDAMICGWVAHRAVTAPQRTMTVGAPERGQLLVPVDSNLRARLGATITRLVAEGIVSPAG